MYMLTDAYLPGPDGQDLQHIFVERGLEAGGGEKERGVRGGGGGRARECLEESSSRPHLETLKQAIDFKSEEIPTASSCVTLSAFSVSRLQRHRWSWIQWYLRPSSR